MRVLALIIIATQLVGCTVYFSPGGSRHETREDARSNYQRMRYKFDSLSNKMKDKPGATANFVRLGGQRVLIKVQKDVNAGYWKRAQYNLYNAIELANRSLELTKLDIYRSRT